MDHVNKAVELRNQLFQLLYELVKIGVVSEKTRATLSQEVDEGIITSMNRILTGVKPAGVKTTQELTKSVTPAPDSKQASTTPAGKTVAPTILDTPAIKKVVELVPSSTGPKAPEKKVKTSDPPHSASKIPEQETWSSAPSHSASKAPEKNVLLLAPATQSASKSPENVTWTPAPPHKKPDVDSASEYERQYRQKIQEAHDAEYNVGRAPSAKSASEADNGNDTSKAPDRISQSFANACKDIESQKQALMAHEEKEIACHQKEGLKRAEKEQAKLAEQQKAEKQELIRQKELHNAKIQADIARAENAAKEQETKEKEIAEQAVKEYRTQMKRMRRALYRGDPPSDLASTIKDGDETLKVTLGEKEQLSVITKTENADEQPFDRHGSPIITYKPATYRVVIDENHPDAMICPYWLESEASGNFENLCSHPGDHQPYFHKHLQGKHEDALECQFWREGNCYRGLRCQYAHHRTRHGLVKNMTGKDKKFPFAIPEEGKSGNERGLGNSRYALRRPSAVPSKRESPAPGWDTVNSSLDQGTAEFRAFLGATANKKPQGHGARAPLSRESSRANPDENLPGRPGYNEATFW